MRKKVSYRKKSFISKKKIDSFPERTPTSPSRDSRFRFLRRSLKNIFFHFLRPFAYEYGVKDEYSGAYFDKKETQDEYGVVAGEYRVALPDGRTQVYGLFPNKK